MKEKTKKKLNMVIVLLMVAVFALGTLLLYLPVGQPANPQYTPPPLNQIPEAQQQNQPPTPNPVPPAAAPVAP